MIDATLELFLFDYGHIRATIEFTFSNEDWSIKNRPYFSSPKLAENRARRLAKKLGLNITKVKIDEG